MPKTRPRSPRRAWCLNSAAACRLIPAHVKKGQPAFICTFVQLRNYPHDVNMNRDCRFPARFAMCQPSFFIVPSPRMPASKPSEPDLVRRVRESNAVPLIPGREMPRTAGDFVAPLFSWSYELLFPQVPCFQNDLRCPRGVPPLPPQTRRMVRRAILLTRFVFSNFHSPAPYLFRYVSTRDLLLQRGPSREHHLCFNGALPVSSAAGRLTAWQL